MTPKAWHAATVLNTKHVGPGFSKQAFIRRTGEDTYHAISGGRTIRMLTKEQARATFRVHGQVAPEEQTRLSNIWASEMSR